MISLLQQRRYKFESVEKLSDRFQVHAETHSRLLYRGFSAVDLQFDREVLLWIAKPHLEEDQRESLKARLVRTFAAGISHAPVCALGCLAAGVPFYAQVRGDLRIASRAKKSAAQKSLLLLDASTELAELGSKGIVLGDIYEDSFLLDSIDTLQLHGVFSLGDTEPSAELLESTPQKTSFVAPEILSGERASAASDVFSWGCFAYSLISGNTFPRGLNEYQHYEHVRIQVPAMCEATGNRGVEALAPIIEKSLSWKPEERFDSAAALKSEIEARCPGLRTARGQSYFIRFARFSRTIGSDPIARMILTGVPFLILSFVLLFSDHGLQSSSLATGIMNMRGTIDDGDQVTARLSSIGKSKGSEQNQAGGRPSMLASQSLQREIYSASIPRKNIGAVFPGDRADDRPVSARTPDEFSAQLPAQPPDHITEQLPERLSERLQKQSAATTNVRSQATTARPQVRESLDTRPPVRKRRVLGEIPLPAEREEVRSIQTLANSKAKRVASLTRLPEGRRKLRPLSAIRRAKQAGRNPAAEQRSAPGGRTATKKSHGCGLVKDPHAYDVLREGGFDILLTWITCFPTEQ